MTSDLSTSLWFDTCKENVATSPLHEDVVTDLVIVGGGITGCSAALQAARDGANVRLIEANSIGHGGSGRNVGLANAGLWLPPDRIKAKIGDAQGAKLSAILAQGPATVFGLIKQFNIDCEPVQNGTLYCAHAPSGVKDLKHCCSQLQAIGAPVRRLSRDEAVARTGTKHVYGALFDPRAGTIQPLSYVRGLARAAAGLGAKIHEKTPALSITNSGDDWLVKTPDGTIRAKSLILATNAYHEALQGMPALKTIPVHYFQAATAPLDAAIRAKILPQQEGCWDTALVMSSWRMDQAGRLIIGGMGDLGHPGSGIHRSWVKRKIAKLFPALKGVMLPKLWVGRIAMTPEHLPRTLQLGNTGLTTFGYSGRGIGPGTIYGQRMAQALLSGDYADLPREPEMNHSIAFPKIQQLYYETGATMIHAISARR